MNLKQQLTEDMKQAMRDRNSLRLSVIRFLIAEIKNREIDEGELSDEQVLKTISKQVKQINEVMSDYERSGKTDQLAEEKQKAEILESYLPEQMSDDQLVELVDKVFENAEDKSMGSLIRMVREQAGSQADGSKIAALVKQKLS